MTGWARVKSLSLTDYGNRWHFFQRANTTGCGMRAVQPELEPQDAPAGLACHSCARAWRNVWPTTKAAQA